jgi:SpoVK/Ycf46/Vps4 family AAA+-type ATPase
MSKMKLDQLGKYLKTHSREFPLLLPALKNLGNFVGHDEIKETVCKMVLYFIAQHEKQPRRSKRKRVSRKKKALAEAKRRRTFSTDVSSDEDSDYDPEIVDSAKMALMALLTHSLAGGGDSSSDEEEEVEDPVYVKECREKINLLNGHFLHTLLLGNPGSGKTTFATLLVNVWDSIGIISKERFRITKRSDFIGKYQGHSVAKTKKLIDSCKGGVIFIDEAYSLISAKDGDDLYGREVLTEIVEAMSNPDRQVLFIFAGYEKDMKSLLRCNDGLERRFGYVYRFSTVGAGLIQSIFWNQLKLNGWKIAKNDRKEVCEFFARNFKHLKHAGGSTNQLLFHAQQNSVCRQFPNKADNILCLKDLEDGLKTFSNHAQVFTKAKPPKHMYL